MNKFCLMKLSRVKSERFTAIRWLAMVSALLALLPGAGATLRVWSGNATMNSTWTDAQNWAGGIAPVAGDDLQFPFDGSHPNATDNYTNGTTFNSITFWHGGSGAAINYNLGGNSIALNAGISAVNNNPTLWANTVNNAFLLNSNQTFTTGLYTSLALLGAINLNGKNLTFDTAAFSPIDVRAVISGAGGLIKTNPGTLSVYSNNTYTGSTTLSGGTLALSGAGAIRNSTNIALSGASAILSIGSGFTLNTGQTLSGIGLVAGGVTALSGSVISPGNNGVGTLTFNNNLTLNAAATLMVVLNGTNAGTSYNQLSVQALALNNATLAVTLGYTPAIGDRFIIITNAGASAVSGIFSGLPEGTFFTNNGVRFRISYTGSDGNDVVLYRAEQLPPLIVTSTADSAAGSLRAVLAAATNGNTIVFATNVTGVIKLTTGELLVNQSVSIIGPGPAILAVDGHAASRVFHITNAATVSISGLTITNGAVSGINAIGGGGLWNDHSTLTLSNCTVVFNTSGNGPGGAIYNDGSSGSATLSLVATTLSQNYTVSGNGGGIYNDGDFGSATLSIIASTFDRNSAGGNGNVGGGIFNDGYSGSATLSLSNCTSHFNLATYGGGIYNSGASGTGAVAVVACTFSDDDAQSGFGADLYINGTGGRLQIGDTILAGGGIGQTTINNQAGGAVISLGYNLCSDFGSGLLTNATDQVHINPRLGQLADNGGPTPTHALLWGSPGIDKGKSFGLTTDQRGVPRPFDFASITNATSGDGSDIGAFEFIPPAPLISIAAVTNSIQLQGAGLSNLTYTIQANTNLSTTNWLVVGSAPADGSGLFSFSDTNAPPFPRRFYRALSQ